MDAHEPSLPSRSHGILGWLRRAPRGPQPDAIDPSEERSLPADPRHDERQRMLDQIGAFLHHNRLDLTSMTLGAAYEVTAGTDPRLSMLIAERQRADQPVTAEWLAEMRGADPAEDESKVMSHLMDRLEGNIHTLTRTTIDVRTATSEYHTAVRGHVSELQQVGFAGSVVGELVAIAQLMVERTREIELQMARSERDARVLQRSLDKARRSAEIDHLTGLPNRRAFEARLDKEVLAARTAGEPLCVAFCDIDRFKKINDTHGHDAGDRVLKAVARALGDISGDRCHVARHGGEEFVILLRGLPLASAYDLLDETRAQLADRRMVNRANDVPFGKVTFSAGVASVFDYADPRAALKAADEALYVAKNEGRNRIVRAPARLMLVAEPKAA